MELIGIFGLLECISYGYLYIHPLINYSTCSLVSEEFGEDVDIDEDEKSAEYRKKTFETNI